MPTASVEAARWRVDPGRRNFDDIALRCVLASAFPGRRMRSVAPFAEGLRNSNFRVELDGHCGAVVLRVFEHDASICTKELNLLRRIGGLAPVPEVLFAAPEGLGEFPPFLCLRYLEGISMRELKRAGDPARLAAAAHSAGATLASLASLRWERPGWIGRDGEVDAPHPQAGRAMSGAVAEFLAAPPLRNRVGVAMVRVIAEWWDGLAASLAPLAEARQLVHGDFGKCNLLVGPGNGFQPGPWTVTGVLDWEYALAGSPLVDVGHLLRYERAAQPRLEPHFSRGFAEAGGVLPPDWRRLARALDLIALLESLARDTLPGGFAIEIAALVKATVEDADPPQFR